MSINWPLVVVLFLLSLPGIMIVVPRLMDFLIPQANALLLKRISMLAILQSLIMTFIMCLGGAVISQQTGLGAPLIEAMLQGQSFWPQLQHVILPALGFGFLALILFSILFYGIAASILDEKSYTVMRRLHQKIGLDGGILYAGLVEEIISRWGIMNAVVFFSLLFSRGEVTARILWSAAAINGILYALGQLPAYFAAGCAKSRRFIYMFFLLHLCLSLIFSYVFWQYGLLAAIFSHMSFHLGWYVYDRPKSKT